MSTIGRPRTRRLRLPLTVLGVLAFVVGVTTIVVPGFAAAVPIETIVGLLGNDYLLVAAVAGGALLAVLAVLVARAATGLSQATPPDPENIHNVALFGERFDEVLSNGHRGSGAGAGGDSHPDVRARLREAVIATVMREASCTRAEATERVDRGTWTDDADAARFLGDSPAAVDSTSGAGGRRDTSLGASLGATFGGETEFQRGARRAATAIVRLDAEATE